MKGDTHFDLMAIFGARSLVAFGILFSLMLWWLVLKVVRVLVRNKDAFGTTATIRLVALGITAWFVPQAISAPVDAIAAYIKPFLEKLPPPIASVTNYANSKDITFLADFMPQLTGVFVSALTDFLRELGLPRLVFAIALWAGLGTFLTVLLQGETIRIRRWTGWLESTQYEKYYAVHRFWASSPSDIRSLSPRRRCGGYQGGAGRDGEYLRDRRHAGRGARAGRGALANRGLSDPNAAAVLGARYQQNRRLSEGDRGHLLFELKVGLKAVHCLVTILP